MNTDALLEAHGSGWLHAYVPRAPHGDTALAALRARTTAAAFEQARTQGRATDAAHAAQLALTRQPASGRP